MAQRSRYLLTYDIRNAGRLRRVHEVALEFGEMLQYSVYVCDLTAVEFVAMRAKLRTEMHLDVDSVSIFDLGPPDGKVVERIEHLGVRVSLPSGEHGVW